MDDLALARRRLASQRLAGPRCATPAEAVAWMGAVQAQDRAGALWAIGQRTRRAREADLARAFDQGSIVRTWPMRGTLHAVAAEDARWMVALLAPRAVQRAAGRRRALGLTPRVLERSRRALAAALAGGQRLTRPQAYAVLERGGVATRGQRGIHILGHLAQLGVLCLGPMEGRQPTFVLLDEWVRAPLRPSARPGLLADLAGRYVASHGPARAADLAWWAGLPLADARAGLAGAPGLQAEGDDGGLWTAARPRALPGRGQAHLLPPFDELLVGYKDRAASLARVPPRDRRPAEGLLSPVATVDGQVVATWTRARARGRVEVRLRWVAPRTRADEEAVARAAERYAAFLGAGVVLG